MCEIAHDYRIHLYCIFYPCNKNKTLRPLSKPCMRRSEQQCVSRRHCLGDFRTNLLKYDSYDELKNYFEPLGSDITIFSFRNKKTAPNSIYFSAITKQLKNKPPP